jgi:hypothetical protein
MSLDQADDYVSSKRIRPKLATFARRRRRSDCLAAPEPLVIVAEDVEGEALATWHDPPPGFCEVDMVAAAMSSPATAQSIRAVAGIVAHVLGEIAVEGIGDLRFRTVVPLEENMDGDEVRLHGCLSFPAAKAALNSGAWTESRTARFQASSPLKCRSSRGCQTTRTGVMQLVGDRAPAKGFGDEVPGHWSAPSDEVRGTVVETVPRFIDDEAETARAVFVRGDEIAALFGRAAIAAKCGDAFRHAGMVVRADG